MFAHGHGAAEAHAAGDLLDAERRRLQKLLRGRHPAGDEPPDRGHPGLGEKPPMQCARRRVRAIGHRLSRPRGCEIAQNRRSQFFALARPPLGFASQRRDELSLASRADRRQNHRSGNGGRCRRSALLSQNRQAGVDSGGDPRRGPQPPCGVVRVEHLRIDPHPLVPSLKLVAKTPVGRCVGAVEQAGRREEKGPCAQGGDVRSGAVKPKHEGRGALDVVSDDAGPGGAGTGGVFPGGGGRDDAASAGDGADDVGIDRPERANPGMTSRSEPSASWSGSARMRRPPSSSGSGEGETAATSLSGTPLSRRSPPKTSSAAQRSKPRIPGKRTTRTFMAEFYRQAAFVPLSASRRRWFP